MSTSDELARLIEQCSRGDLSDADEAMLASTLAREPQPEKLMSFLDVGLECNALIATLLSAFHDSGREWPWSSSATLVEALLANGMDSEADSVAHALRGQRPRDVEAARLWALCGSDELEVIRRFAQAYADVDDRSALERSVHDFTSRSHIAGLRDRFIELVRGDER